MGFPIDLFLSTPDPNLICPICQDVLDDPTTLECGHVFCRPCLLSYQEVRTPRNSGGEKRSTLNEPMVCPTCRHMAVPAESVPSSLLVKSIVENLHVRCKNQQEREEAESSHGPSEGKKVEEHSQAGKKSTPAKQKYASVESCDWTGKLSEFKSHAEHNCPLEFIVCKSEGCKTRQLRGYMRSGYCQKSECAVASARQYLLDRKEKSTNTINEKSTPCLGKKSLDGFDNEKENVCGNKTFEVGIASLMPGTADETETTAKGLATTKPSLVAKTADLRRPLAANTQQFFANKIENNAKQTIAQVAKSAAFVVGAVKVLVDEEMSKIRKSLSLEGTHITAAHCDIDTVRAMFVQRHLVEFCRSWRRSRPDPLHDFVIYRPNMNHSSPSVYIRNLLCGIPGPKHTTWEGGLFPVLMEWHDVDSPPKCKFPNDFWHPNVNASGELMLSTLNDSEDDGGHWYPEITIPEILFDIQQLLAHPNHGTLDQRGGCSSQYDTTNDYKTMIQTSIYSPRSFMEMASGIEGFDKISSWQLVDNDSMPRNSNPSHRSK